MLLTNHMSQPVRKFSMVLTLLFIGCFSKSLTKHLLDLRKFVKWGVRRDFVPSQSGTAPTINAILSSSALIHSALLTALRSKGQAVSLHDESVTGASKGCLIEKISHFSLILLL